MRKDALVLLRDHSRHHRQVVVEHLAAASLVVNLHRVRLLRRPVALDHAIAVLHQDLPRKEGPRLHLNLGGLGKTLGGVGSDCVGEIECQCY